MEDHCHCSGKEGHRLRPRKSKNCLELMLPCVCQKNAVPLWSSLTYPLSLSFFCLFSLLPQSLLQSPSTLSYILLPPIPMSLSSLLASLSLPPPLSSSSLPLPLSTYPLCTPDLRLPSSLQKIVRVQSPQHHRQVTTQSHTG